MTTSKTWKPDSLWQPSLNLSPSEMRFCRSSKSSCKPVNKNQRNCCFLLSSFETDLGNRKLRTNQTVSTSKIYLFLKWGSHSLCPSDGLASPGLDARVSSTQSNLWPEKVESKKSQNPSKKIPPNSFRSLRSPAFLRFLKFISYCLQVAGLWCVPSCLEPGYYRSTKNRNWTWTPVNLWLLDIQLCKRTFYPIILYPFLIFVGCSLLEIAI